MYWPTVGVLHKHSSVYLQKTPCQHAMSVVIPVFQDSSFSLSIQEAKPLFWARWFQCVGAAWGCTSRKAQPVLALQCGTISLLSRGANLPLLDNSISGRSTRTRFPCFTGKKMSLESNTIDRQGEPTQCVAAGCKIWNPKAPYQASIQWKSVFVSATSI